MIDTIIGTTDLPNEFQTIILSDKSCSSLLLVKYAQRYVLITVQDKSQYLLHVPVQLYNLAKKRIMCFPLCPYVAF